MLWNGHRVPFTLLGGYLGAGKTTIVNHVVRNAGGRRIVVLVNDVAAVNIDAALIADHDGTTLSLSNGCVCCSIADDFAQTLEQIRAMSEAPDHVLMELSGVGEPERVVPWANTTGFRLDGIVVAADADQIDELADRPFVGDTIGAQLRAADLVVLTKSDLAADGGSVARRRIQTFSSAPIVDVVNGAIDVDVLIGLGSPTGVSGETGRMRALPVEHGEYPDHHATRLIELGSVTHEELSSIVDSLPVDVIRAKALVRCSDVAPPVEVHVVGKRRTIRPRPDLDQAVAAQAMVVITVVA
jgi:G3E family GTPase